MKNLKVIVSVDIISKDGNMIINKACDALEEEMKNSYGIRIRCERSMSRIYKRQTDDHCHIRRYSANNLFFPTYDDQFREQTFVIVSVIVSEKQLNKWKLRSIEDAQRFTSQVYNKKVFLNVITKK